MLAKFFPFGGWRMAEIDDFWPLSQKPTTKTTSYVVYTLDRWVFKNMKFGKI